MSDGLSVKRCRGQFRDKTDMYIYSATRPRKTERERNKTKKEPQSFTQKMVTPKSK